MSDKDFFKYIKDYKVEGKNDEYTHTFMNAPYGKYNIPNKEYKKFLEQYTNAIKDENILSLTEKQDNIGPLIIDLDLHHKEKQRYYTDNTIKKFCKILLKILNDLFDLDDDQTNIYISEKKEPIKKKDIYVDGLHIVLPKIIIKKHLKKIVRAKLIEKLDSVNFFGELNVVNSIESIIDLGVMTGNVGWMLYGSSKYQDIYYKLTKIFIKNNDSYELDDKIELSIKKIVYKLAVRHPTNTENEINLKSDIDNNELDEYLCESARTSEKSVNSDVFENKINKEIKDDKYIATTSETILSESKILTNFLSIKRATTFITWYQVGLCLHNIDYTLLNDWIEFSKKCPEKFQVGECKKLWLKMKPNTYTISSLYYWASLDDPKSFENFLSINSREYLKDSLKDLTDYDIANAAYMMYKHEFACVDIGSKLWYYFSNHRWHLDAKSRKISIKLSEHMSREYIKLSHWYETQAKSKKGTEQEEFLMAKADKARNMGRHSLKTKKFKNTIIEQCSEIFYRDDFVKNLDENKNLVGFENGIFDLEHKIFREGCPDDMVSMTTKLNYYDLDKDDIYYKELMVFLKSIFPEKDKREYVLNTLSYVVSGDCSKEEFYFFTGTGSNGKSKLFLLIKNALGNYYKPMDARVLTQKRGSASGASPELADKKGVRCCSLDEPEADSTIQGGFLKYQSGGDELCCRGLFKDPIYFYPQYKSFLICNDLPELSNVDGGLIRRIKVVHFDQKFVDNPSKPYEHPRDYDLDKKIANWGEAFISLLIGRYLKVKENGMTPEPESIKVHTREYLQDCDRIMEFIDGNYIHTDKQTDKCIIADMYRDMVKWYKDSYQDSKCPPKKKLIDYLKKNKTENFTKTTLSGYKEKFASDDDENNATSISKKLG